MNNPPVLMTVANLMDLSSFGHSLNFKVADHFSAETGQFDIGLHGVKMASVPALADHLRRVGFDVPDELDPSSSPGAWYLRATADVGIWKLQFVGYVSEPRKTEPRNPLPLSEINNR